MCRLNIKSKAVREEKWSHSEVLKTRCVEALKDCPFLLSAITVEASEDFAEDVPAARLVGWSLLLLVDHGCTSRV